MSNIDYSINSERVAALCLAIEQKLKHRVLSPADFDWLADKIERVTHQHVGVSTLKRIWGYIADKGEDHLPGIATVRILTVVAGFSSYEAFIDSLTDEDIQSEEYSGEALRCKTLPVGAVISLEWKPDRQCRMRHLGNCRFEVIASVNAKIRMGDVATCHQVVAGVPLCLENICRQGEKKPLSYIAGSRTGVRFTIDWQPDAEV